MELIQVVGIGIIATVIIAILRQIKPEAAVQASIITGVVIFLLIAGKLAGVVRLLESYSKNAGINMQYFNILLKIIGIAYITEFGAEVCRDSGESAIASKIELAGKVVIMALAVPVVTSLLDLILGLLPG